MAAGGVTQDRLIEVQAEVQNPDNLSLTVAPEHYGGACVEGIRDVPMYCHAKLVVDEYGDPEAYEVNYITYYAFNGHYDLPAGLPLFRRGHHVGDWEHLTVRLDAASLELQGVWYNAHRNLEGEWCPAAQVPRSPCGRILGYVALNGHGIYPTCGVIPRLFFVANDRTSSRGPVWNPARIVRLCGLAHGSGCPVVPSRGCSLPWPPARGGARGPTTVNTRPPAVDPALASGSVGAEAGLPWPVVVHDASPWQRYRGRWGTIVSPTEQGWFLGPEPPVSRGLLRRLFLPCAGGVGRLRRRQRQPLPGTTGVVMDSVLASLKAVLLTTGREAVDRKG